MNKYNPILYDDIDEDLYVFKVFGELWSTHHTWLLVFVLNLFYGIKNVDQPELRMYMPLFVNPFSISFMINGIPSVNEEFHNLCLALTFVLIHVNYHPFVIINQFTDSTKVRQWLNKYLISKLVVWSLTMKGLVNLYFCLPRNYDRRATMILTLSFGNCVPVISYWIVSS